MFIVIIAGVCVIFWALAVFIRSNRYMKKGTLVDFKVVNIKPSTKFLGVVIANIVTIEFEYDGKIIQKTIKKYAIFEKNVVYKGWYIDNRKKNCIYMYGDMHLDFSGLIMFILAGLLFIVTPLSVYLKWSPNIILSIPSGIITLVIVVQWIDDIRNGYKNINPNDKNPYNVSRPDLIHKYNLKSNDKNRKSGGAQ